MKQPFEDRYEAAIDKVDITDDVMFSYVMRNPEICIELLQYLLPDKKIRKIEYLRINEAGEGEERAERKQSKPETQKVLVSEFDKRGVRLDVYLDDGKTVYNVEMQTSGDKAIARRTRLYQAHIDINQLEHGQNYDQLKPSFVIFICKYDPFGEGLYRYSFENVCQEKPDLRLNDEAYKLFFNTMGTHGTISDPLKELLRYMNDTKRYPVEDTKNGLIQRIEQAVGMAKRDKDWRRAYMTQQIRDREIELRAEERGMQIGEKRGILTGKMQEKQETAKKMLQAHMAADVVANITGLPLSEVAALAHAGATIKH